jgi:hypothetical protein
MISQGYFLFPSSIFLTQSFSTSHDIEIHFFRSLYDNNISAEGAKALADALQSNTTLTTLE